MPTVWIANYQIEIIGSAHKLVGKAHLAARGRTHANYLYCTKVGI